MIIMMKLMSLRVIAMSIEVKQNKNLISCKQVTVERNGVLIDI